MCPQVDVSKWVGDMSVSTGGCVLVGREYECVHRWVCPSG